MGHVLASPAVVSSRIPAGETPAPRPVASVSAVLHVGALAALCLLVAPRRVPPAPPPPSFAMVMAPLPAAPVTEQTLQQAQLRAPFAAAATMLSAPMPLSLAPPTPVSLHFSNRRVSLQAPQAAPVPAPAAAAKPAAQAGAPPSASQHSVAQNMLSGLEARIRQAVQDAAIYPPPARAMHVEGRTQVRFDYTDGSVGPTDIAISSNSGMLDRAAVAAVRRAILPRAPAEIGSRRLALLVWVDFRLVRQD